MQVLTGTLVPREPDSVSRSGMGVVSRQVTVILSVPRNTVVPDATYKSQRYMQNSYTIEVDSQSTDVFVSKTSLS